MKGFQSRVWLNLTEPRCPIMAEIRSPANATGRLLWRKQSLKSLP